MPAFVLLFLCAYLVGRGIGRFENRLIIVITASFFIAHVAEFLRHIVSVSYSPFIVTWIIGGMTMLGMSASLHLAYLLLSKSLQFSIERVRLYFYIGLLFPLISAVLPALQLHESDFFWQGPWLYRDQVAYSVGIYLFGFAQATAIMVALIVGVMRSRNSVYKKQFSFLVKNGIFFSGLLLLFVAQFQQNAMPPIPVIHLGFLVSVMLAICILYYHYAPSVADQYKRILTLTPTAVIVLNHRFDIIERNAHAKAFFHQFHLRNAMTDAKTKALVEQILQTLQREKTLQSARYSFVNPDDDKKYVFEFDGYMDEGYGEPYYYLIWRDVTFEYEQELQIRELAYTDSLTKLHNRTYFVPTMKKHLLELSDQEQALFILSDLNFFKHINDTYGHAIGDAVLQHTANILKSLEQKGGLVARLGGDEFIMYIPEQKDAKQLVAFLREKFESEPFLLDDGELIVCPSFGVVTIPLEGTDFEVLYHLADERMYEDKKRIKERVR